MSDRSEDLSGFHLTGGPMKLNIRSSTSSLSPFLKKYHSSRISSRPSSAIPRLCSGDNTLEDLTSTKNDHRPYSADYVIPSLLSSNSKETLTDGSFESVYVPLDSTLPSSNLFRKLYEEDVDQWQSSGARHVEGANSTRNDDKSPNSVSIDTGKNNTDDFNEKTTDRIDNAAENRSTEKLLKISENREELFDEQLCNTAYFRNESQYYSVYNADINKENNVNLEISVRHEPTEDKYNLTPGLTTKPPLPKKNINSQSAATESMHNNAIYEFFAIKYNSEHQKSISLTGNAEKPMSEDTSERAKPEEKEEPNIPNESHGNVINNCQMENNNIINSSKENLAIEITQNNCVKEEAVNTHNLKESERGKHGQKITSFDNGRLKDITDLSEIDIDALFGNGNENGEEEKFEISNQLSLQSLHYSNSKKTEKGNKKGVKLPKATETKCTPLKKSSSTNNPDKSSVNNKISIERSRGKFIPAAIKLSKPTESPRHKKHLFEDNIETWISRTEEKTNVKRHDFTDLINTVEDLKCTTDINNTDVAINCATPKLDDDKHVDCDDIETIIEALEYQDKASQNNIKSMKKIVTNELSNSMILNENESNLKFKKKNDINQDIFENLTITSPINDNDSGLVSPAELYPDCMRSTNAEIVQEKEPTKDYEEKQEIVAEVQDNGTEFIKPPERLHSYRELLTYLDQADKKCTKTLEVVRERTQTAPQPVPESSNSFDTMPKMEDLLSHTQEELASYVIDISLRLKDKTSCIAILQNELSLLRQKLLTHTKQAENNLRHKMREQKEETERIAKRHQKFIDQLMEEKKTFARRCEELVNEMTAMEEKYVSNMRAIEHKHHVEMQKMKDMCAASEKLRRERWIEGKTQKIKEMAVKSIEPEVERMEKRHQEEISNLRAVHKREIEELELRAARKLQEHSETLREHLVQDREKAIAHERDVMRLRYEKMVESEEKNYQEQRRRLLADHANRMAQCEEREVQAAADKERAIKQAQQEFEEKLQAAARRHVNEMKLVKETVVIELENWKNSFRKQQSALLIEKETSIRQQCRKERDREIEAVIERLEADAHSTKTQLEQATENRIKRLRDKYEAEIRDLEMLEKDSQSKYSECRSKLVEYENAILNLRTTIKQLENQLKDEKLQRSKLESEREEVRKTIRKEFEDNIQSLEREVEALRASADKQVEQLYSRVRVSLARKDDLLEELTNDHKALKEKCIYLESIIEQQRKEFMINS